MGSAKHYPFWTHDTVAAALLAGVGMAILQNKLDAWASELNVPAVTACVRVWPMLAMFAGITLLVLHSVESRAERGQEQDAEIVQTRDLDEAVGDGLWSGEGEEPVLCPGGDEVESFRRAASV